MDATSDGANGTTAEPRRLPIGDALRPDQDDGFAHLFGQSGHRVDESSMVRAADPIWLGQHLSRVDSIRILVCLRYSE
jgi:hypothetical protein